MFRSIDPARPALVVFATLIAIAALGCDETPDPATKLPGTWQVNDFSTASSAVKFTFSQTALDLRGQVVQNPPPGARTQRRGAHR